MTPISRPDEPMKAKYRGRGWAMLSSRARAASAIAVAVALAACRQALPQEHGKLAVERRLPDPEAVEAPPGLGDDRRRAGEGLLATDVESEHGSRSGRLRLDPAHPRDDTSPSAAGNRCARGCGPRRRASSHPVAWRDGTAAAVR